MDISSVERERLVGMVREVSEPEKVYLLWRMMMKRRAESVFAAEMPGCHYVAHHYLLVLAGNARETHEVQERIEARCKAAMPLTVIVIRGDEFEGWVKEVHPFARRVIERALLLYDGTGVALTVSGVRDAVAEGKESRAIFNNGMEKTEGFVAGADLYKARKEYGMAMFMLH